MIFTALENSRKSNASKKQLQSDKVSQQSLPNSKSQDSSKFSKEEKKQPSLNQPKVQFSELSQDLTIKRSSLIKSSYEIPSSSITPSQKLPKSFDKITPDSSQQLSKNTDSNMQYTITGFSEVAQVLKKNPDYLSIPAYESYIKHGPFITEADKNSSERWIHNMKLPNGSIYSGEITNNNIIEGKGVVVKQDKSIFEGNFIEGRVRGYGRLIDHTGMIYQGIFLGKYLKNEGTITSKDDNQVYAGEVHNNLPHGKGKEIWSNGSTFKGNFRKGQRHGYGEFMWTDKSSYQGNFRRHRIQGHGIYSWSDGRRYEGYWKYNKMNGAGIFSWPGGKIYKGEFRKGKKEGFGVLKYPNKSWHVGNWENNLKQGHGVEYDYLGSLTVGVWETGELNIAHKQKHALSKKQAKKYQMRAVQDLQPDSNELKSLQLISEASEILEESKRELEAEVSFKKELSSESDDSIEKEIIKIPSSKRKRYRQDQDLNYSVVIEDEEKLKLEYYSSDMSEDRSDRSTRSVGVQMTMIQSNQNISGFYAVAKSTNSKNDILAKSTHSKHDISAKSTHSKHDISAKSTHSKHDISAKSTHSKHDISAISKSQGKPPGKSPGKSEIISSGITNSAANLIQAKVLKLVQTSKFAVPEEKRLKELADIKDVMKEVEQLFTAIEVFTSIGPFVYLDPETPQLEWSEWTNLAESVFYKGEIKNGSKHGRGVIVAQDHIYEGHWENQQKQGIGRQILANGDVYEGAWNNNLRHGFGVLWKNSGEGYIGDWEDDIPHGKGTEISKLVVYEGDFVQGLKIGKGKFIYKDGSYYEGEIDHNAPHGYGFLVCSDGRGYVGQWKKGEMKGKGAAMKKDVKMINAELFYIPQILRNPNKPPTLKPTDEQTSQELDSQQHSNISKNSQDEISFAEALEEDSLLNTDQSRDHEFEDIGSRSIKSRENAKHVTLPYDFHFQSLQDNSNPDIVRSKLHSKTCKVPRKSSNHDMVRAGPRSKSLKLKKKYSISELEESQIEQFIPSETDSPIHIDEIQYFSFDQGDISANSVDFHSGKQLVPGKFEASSVSRIFSKSPNIMT